MEINKTYDLEKLHEIVSTAIEDALKTKLFHAKIDLISAKEITEILKEEQIREEKRKHIADDMIKNSTKSFGVLDENMNPVFVEIEHPETEMLQEEHDKMLQEISYLKTVIEEKENRLQTIKSCYSEMKGCYEVCLNCENSRSCVNAVLTKEKELEPLKECGEEQSGCDSIDLPKCYGSFDSLNIDCLKCKEKKYCLSEKQCEETADDDYEWLFDDKVKPKRPKCYNQESITEEIAKRCKTCYYSEECRNG